MKPFAALLTWITQSGTPWRPYASTAWAHRSFPSPDIPARAQWPKQALGAASSRQHGYNNEGDDDGARLMMLSRIAGADVLDSDGRIAGRIQDLSIDTRSGCIAYAMVASGRTIATSARPFPWALLTFDASRGGWRLPFKRAMIEAAPDLSSAVLRHDDPS